MLEAIHVFKEPLLQLREVSGDKVAAARTLPAQADSRDRKRMIDEPFVDLALHALKGFERLRRIVRDDEELACGIDDVDGQLWPHDQIAGTEDHGPFHGILQFAEFGQVDGGEVVLAVLALTLETFSVIYSVALAVVRNRHVMLYKVEI